MRVIKTANYEEMSTHVANLIAAEILLNPRAKLGLATGSTPIGAYQTLIEYNQKHLINFSQVSTYNLDEYRGLEPTNDQSYRYFMNHQLFDHINIDKANTHVPDGSNPDAQAACKAYDELLEQAGYVDLQLLGIGRNGHIGFNEPAESFSKGTLCVDLTPSTIEANSRLFASKDEVPKQAYTMGTQAIMYAKTVVICASGADKADAVASMIAGPITPECPASILQLHPNTIVVADKEALANC